MSFSSLDTTTLQSLLYVVGAIVVLMTIFAEIGKTLLTQAIKKWGPKDPNKKTELELIKEIMEMLKDEKQSVLTPKEREQLSLLYNLHNKYDDNGVPVWYHMGNTSKKTLKVLEKISDTESRIVDLLESHDEDHNK